MSPNLQAAILALLITANSALAEWRLRQVRREVEAAKGEVHELGEKLPSDPWTH